MALHAYDNISKLPTQLIALQEQGKNKPIYCWPGLGGCVMNLRSLAEHMGQQQPFYGIQVQGINEQEIPHACIQDMAATDIRLIKQLQPNGPYTL